MSFTNDVYQQLTVRGVPRQTFYREAVPASPTYVFDKETGGGAQEFYIPWRNAAGGDSIPQARMDFLGYTTVAVSGGVKYLSRVIPYEHPSFLNNLFAQTIPSVSGFIPADAISPKGGDAKGVGFYKEAQLRVTYSTLSYNVLTDFELTQATGGTFDESTWQRYVTVQIDTTGYNQRLPSFAALRWTDDQTAMDNAASVPICQGDVSITWHQIPIIAIPWTAIVGTGIGDGACGKMNATAIGLTSPNNSYFFQAESLVCLTPKIRPYYKMSNGAFATDITYRFKYHPAFSANHFYKWRAAAFVKATRTGANDGSGFFKPFFFQHLFVPEP